MNGITQLFRALILESMALVLLFWLAFGQAHKTQPRPPVSPLLALRSAPETRGQGDLVSPDRSTRMANGQGLHRRPASSLGRNSMESASGQGAAKFNVTWASELTAPQQTIKATPSKRRTPIMAISAASSASQRLARDSVQAVRRSVDETVRSCYETTFRIRHPQSRRFASTRVNLPSASKPRNTPAPQASPTTRGVLVAKKRRFPSVLQNRISPVLQNRTTAEPGVWRQPPKQISFRR